MKKQIPKWVMTVLLNICICGLLGCIHPRGRGSLTVKFIGVNAARVLVSSYHFSKPHVFENPDNNAFKISPLPYGPYKIHIRYPDKREFEVEFWHYNNWHKESISFTRPNLDELQVEALHIANDSIEEAFKHIDLSQVKKPVRLGYI